MTLSNSVKFFVLIFLNVACTILCGWYGIQHVMISRAENETHDEGPLKQKSEAQWRMLSGGSAAIAFALLSFLNLSVIVVTRKKVSESKSSDCSSCGSILFHCFTLCMIVLGTIVVVLLGLLSSSVENTRDNDVVFVSIVIAFVLISVLMQVSTVNISGNGCKKNKRHKPGPEISHKRVSEQSTDQDRLVQSSGNKVERPIDSFEAETSFMTPYPSASLRKLNHHKMPQHFRSIPTIHVTSVELNVAKQRLKKSTTSSSNGLGSSSSFGGYRPPKMMPILVEDLISECQSNLGFDGSREDLSVEVRLPQDGRVNDGRYYAAPAISGIGDQQHQHYLRPGSRQDFAFSDASSDYLSDDVFLPPGQSPYMPRQWTTPSCLESLGALDNSRNWRGSLPAGYHSSVQPRSTMSSQSNGRRERYRPQSDFLGPRYLVNGHYTSSVNSGISASSSRILTPALRLNFTVSNEDRSENR